MAFHGIHEPAGGIGLRCGPIGFPMYLKHHHIPGSRDSGDQKDSEKGKAPLPEGSPLTREGEIGDHTHQRNDDPHGPLDQHATSHGQIKDGEKPSPGLFMMERVPKTISGQCGEHDQFRIGQHHPIDAQKLQIQQQHAGSEKGHRRTSPLSYKHVLEQQQAETGQSRRQPRGEFIDAKQGIGPADEPIHKSRLGIARFIVESRGNPITALQHFPGRFGITPLIPIRQPQRAQIRAKEPSTIYAQ